MHWFWRLLVTDHAAKLRKLWSARVLQAIAYNATSYSWANLDPSRQTMHLPRGIQLIDPRETADPILTARLRSQNIGDPRWHAVVHIRTRVVVLPVFGVVLVASPPLVLDLAEGCCRPPAPLPAGKLPRAYGLITGKAQRNRLPRWIRIGRLHLLADEVHEDTVEHEWLLHLFHSHSSSYHHAITECGQKLMWTRGLLLAQPEVKVLHDSIFVDQLLAAAGLVGRGVRVRFRSVFARRLTVPPSMNVSGAHVPLVLHSLAGACMAAIAPAPAGQPALLVVRRSTLAHDGGRGMLNHDELLLALRQRLPDANIEEYPPTATLTAAARQWSRARMAICPHGAGCTNMLFMPRHSTVVEVLHYEQRGRVYVTLARNLGHRYVELKYNRTEARGRSQLEFARRAPYTSFVLDVPKLLDLLQSSGAFDAFIPPSPPPPVLLR